MRVLADRCDPVRMRVNVSTRTARRRVRVHVPMCRRGIREPGQHRRRVREARRCRCGRWSCTRSVRDDGRKDGEGGDGIELCELTERNLLKSCGRRDRFEKVRLADRARLRCGFGSQSLGRLRW